MAVQVEPWESRLLAMAYGPLDNWKLEHAHVPSAEETLEAAHAHCATLTRAYSATFYTASGLLPPAQRRAVRALYAFCRVSDDLIDRPDSGDPAAFARWREHALGSHPPADNLVAVAWADARTRFRVPTQYAEQLLDGVAQDLAVKRYATFSDLAGYCYGVASTVGLMSMHIVGYQVKAAVPYAVKLGVALQLTNILRDVGEDWANGRLYLPQDELAAFDLTEEALNARYTGYRWRNFMQFQIARTRKLFDEALPGIAFLERRGRFGVAAAAELYREILTDIERHGYDVFSRRAHTTGLGKITRLPGIWWRANFKGYEDSR